MTGFFVFTRAERSARKARIALAGPSGSGKTWTALELAQTLADRIAVIDTERGSASLYSDAFTFDTLDLHVFDPRDLVRALAAAGSAGYDAAVVDSLSSFWSGTGGMLEQVDHAAKRTAGGNSFGGWKEARPMERAMIDALLAYPGHVIVTMRTKTEFVVEEDARGRKVPRKVGLKPEQREGIEYEFDIVGELDVENTLVITKTRFPALTGAVVPRPGAELGEQIRGWLESGVRLPTVPDYLDRVGRASLGDLRALYQEVARRNLLGAAVVTVAGETSTLGEVIAARGSALTAGAADPSPTPAASADSLAAEAAGAKLAPALPPRRTDARWFRAWKSYVQGATDEAALDKALDELHAVYERRALTVADQDAAKTLLAEKRADLQQITQGWGGIPTQDGAE